MRGARAASARALSTSAHASPTMAAELHAKCVELIHDMLPSAHRVAVIANSADALTNSLIGKVRLAGGPTGIEIAPVDEGDSNRHHLRRSRRTGSSREPGSASTTVGGPLWRGLSCCGRTAC